MITDLLCIMIFGAFITLAQPDVAFWNRLGVWTSEGVTRSIGLGALLHQLQKEKAAPNDPGRLILIDARNRQAFAAGHIPGAGCFEDPSTLKEVDGVLRSDSMAPIVVYCGDELCGRAAVVAFAMRQRGAGNLQLYTGGWREWVSAGLPIEGRKGNP